MVPSDRIDFVRERASPMKRVMERGVSLGQCPTPACSINTAGRPVPVLENWHTESRTVPGVGSSNCRMRESVFARCGTIHTEVSRYARGALPRIISGAQLQFDGGEAAGGVQNS